MQFLGKATKQDYNSIFYSSPYILFNNKKTIKYFLSYYYWWDRIKSY